MVHHPRSNEWREKLPPICPACGYNLTGLAGGKCPECGRPYLFAELRENARRVYHAVRQVEDANDVCAVGVYLGIAGALCVMLFWGVGWGVGLGRVGGFFLGIATFGTGVQVFRVRGFPEWAREILPAPPRYIMGAAVSMFGLAVIALAVFLP